jgi:hypothetical protein
MSRKAQGKGRARGMSPEEMDKLTDAREVPNLKAKEEPKRKPRLVAGLPPRRPARTGKAQ